VVERHVIVEKSSPVPSVPQAPSTTLSDVEQNKRQELLEQLRIADVDGRVKATEELTAFHGDEKVRQALEKALLTDHEAAVRAAAAKALVTQSGSKAVPALKRAYAEDADRQVSQAAYKALIMIQGY
jgi:HEAT repeat protein